jgi:hypothetical protein
MEKSLQTLYYFGTRGLIKQMLMNTKIATASPNRKPRFGFAMTGNQNKKELTETG